MEYLIEDSAGSDGGGSDGDGNGNGSSGGGGYGDGNYGDGNGYGGGYGDGNGYGNYGGYGSGYGDGNGDGGDGGNCKVWVSSDTPILAWHILGEETPEHFGRRLEAKVGVITEYPYRPIMCDQGLHACVEKSDAFRYRPRGTLCRVACSGWIEFDRGKLVCTRRKILSLAS